VARLQLLPFHVGTDVNFRLPSQTTLISHTRLNADVIVNLHLWAHLVPMLDLDLGLQGVGVVHLDCRSVNVLRDTEVVRLAMTSALANRMALVVGAMLLALTAMSTHGDVGERG